MSTKHGKQEQRRKDAHLSIHYQPTDASVTVGAREEFKKLWNGRVGNPSMPGKIPGTYGGNETKPHENLNTSKLKPVSENTTGQRSRTADYAQNNGEEVEVEAWSAIDLRRGDVIEQNLSHKTAQHSVPSPEATPEFLEVQVLEMLRTDLERIYDAPYQGNVEETDPWDDIKGVNARDIIREDLGDKWELRLLFAGKHGPGHWKLTDYMRNLMNGTNLVPEKNETVQNFIIRMANKVISTKYSR